MRKTLQLALVALLPFIVSTVAQAFPHSSNTFVVRVKERVPLEQLASNVMDPTSDRYQKYYSPQEIRALAGPTTDEVNLLLEDLQNRGLVALSSDATGLFWFVREAAVPTLALQAFALSASPLPVNIESISAPDVGFKLYPKLVFPQATDGKAPVSFTPTKIKALYGFDSIYQSGITGKGQHIAIATYDGFNVSDVTYYYQKMALNPMPKIDQVVFNGVPDLDNGSAMETQLDAEFAGALAPGTEIHVFASYENSSVGEAQLFNAVLDDDRAKAVNYSWGSCEKSLSPTNRANMDKIFARAVAQGVNIYVASGDDGAPGCRGDKKNLVADWPSVSPAVISVGGTTLSAINNKLSEVAWSGSGGGISANYTGPLWQSVLSAPYNSTRSVPDVSFNADPKSGQAAYIHYPKDVKDPFSDVIPQWVILGGTSMASPQWAAFNALVNEARAASGKAALGYLNPIIYGFSAADKALGFHDVVKGDNHGYKAGPGWDAVTGWGTPQADALLPLLAQ